MFRAQDLIGQQIDQYRIVSLLGTGGGGVVYLAKHIEYNTSVAIKVLFTQLSVGNISAFVAEAQAVMLDHPHIMRIKKFGVENGYPFFVMKYSPHGNLRQRYPSGTRLPWDKIVLYVRQISNALQYIHDQGLVHRDVKPENMLIIENDDIQLSDFGLIVSSYTINPCPQSLAGTPYYIAPEQIHGKAVRSSDQYALGVIMYEWLTGTLLFTGKLEEILYQHQYVAPVPLTQKKSAILPQIDALILRMLAKNPQERFASMSEFLVALENIPFTPSLGRNIVFTSHSHSVQTLSWSPDGRYIASAGLDKTVQVWEATTGAPIYVYHGHVGEIWDLMWSPDSCSIVSVGSDEVVQVWEATTGYRLMSYEGHKGYIRAVTWSPDGMRIAFAGDDRAAYVWDLKSDQIMCIYDSHTESILSLTWSPDGNTLASCSADSTVRIWNAMTGSHMCTYRKHIDRVTDVAWSPDGISIASTSDDGTVQLWDVHTGEQLHLYGEHTSTVSCIAWSPNGRYLASGSWDKTVRVWDTSNNTTIHVYHGHDQWINAVAWSPDSTSVASSSWDKTVHIFHLVR